MNSHGDASSPDVEEFLEAGSASDAGGTASVESELDAWVCGLVRDRRDEGQEEEEEEDDGGAVNRGRLNVQDLSESVRKLMNHPSSSTLRARLFGLAEKREGGGQMLAAFFERLVEEVDDVVGGETEEAFELRKRDVATEHRTSFVKYASKPFTFEEKFSVGDRLFREKKYRQAYHEFTDAVFACEAHPFVRDVLHFCERRSECEDDEDGEEEEEESGGGGKEQEERRKRVHITDVYLDLKRRQIDSLFLDGQHRKSSVYSHHLMHWMTSHQVNGVAGYHASESREKYILLQDTLGESECALGNVHKAIDGCSAAIARFCELRSIVTLEKDVFNTRQTFFEKMIDGYESGNNCSEEEARACAKILVSKDKQRGVTQDGRFILNDLDSALRISKDGDVIYLEDGIYTPRQPADDCAAADKKRRAAFDIRRAVTIVGSSTNKTVVSGSIVKWGSGTVVFRRLKLRVGEDAASEDTVYLMGGGCEVESCVVESPVNTAFYVISEAGAMAPSTRLDLRHCVISGCGESCQRMICFQGSHPIVNVDSCYVSEVFSFVTVIAGDVVTRGVITITNSVLYDIQDGLKLVVHHRSSLAVHVVGCQFETKLMDSNAPSHALSMTGGSCLVKNNYVYSTHVDSTALSLHSLRRAEIEMNLIESSAEIPRQFALGEGVVLSENLTALVVGTDVVGKRIGFHVSNQFEEENQVHFRDCLSKSCSVGFHVEKKNGSSSEVERRNLEATLVQCQAETCHVGVLVDDWRGARVDALASSFVDVARPVLVSKASPFKVVVSNSEFGHSDEFRSTFASSSSSSSSSDSGSTRNRTDPDQPHPESDASRLYLYFATRENLPHRMAIDQNKYIQISNAQEEKSFHEKYHLFRGGQENDEVS